MFYIPVNIYNGPMAASSECSGQILMCVLNYCRVMIFGHLAQCHSSGTTAAAMFGFRFYVTVAYVRDFNNFQTDTRV